MHDYNSTADAGRKGRALPQYASSFLNNLNTYSIAISGDAGIGIRIGASDNVNLDPQNIKDSSNYIYDKYIGTKFHKGLNLHLGSNDQKQLGSTEATSTNGNSGSYGNGNSGKLEVENINIGPIRKPYIWTKIEKYLQRGENENIICGQDDQSDNNNNRNIIIGTSISSFDTKEGNLNDNNSNARMNNEPNKCITVNNGNVEDQQRGSKSPFKNLIRYFNMSNYNPMELFPFTVQSNKYSISDNKTNRDFLWGSLLNRFRKQLPNINLKVTTGSNSDTFTTVKPDITKESELQKSHNANTINHEENNGNINNNELLKEQLLQQFMEVLRNSSTNVTVNILDEFVQRNFPQFSQWNDKNKNIVQDTINCTASTTCEYYIRNTDETGTLSPHKFAMNNTDRNYFVSFARMEDIKDGPTSHRSSIYNNSSVISKEHIEHTSVTQNSTEKTLQSYELLPSPTENAEKYLDHNYYSLQLNTSNRYEDETTPYEEVGMARYAENAITEYIDDKNTFYSTGRKVNQTKRLYQKSVTDKYLTRKRRSTESNNILDGLVNNTSIIINRISRLIKGYQTKGPYFNYRQYGNYHTAANSTRNPSD